MSIKDVKNMAELNTLTAAASTVTLIDFHAGELELQRVCAQSRSADLPVPLHSLVRSLQGDCSRSPAGELRRTNVR